MNDQLALFTEARGCYCRLNGYWEGGHLRGDQTAGCAASDGPIPGQVEHPFTGWHRYSILEPATWQHPHQVKHSPSSTPSPTPSG